MHAMHHTYFISTQVWGHQVCTRSTTQSSNAFVKCVSSRTVKRAHFQWAMGIPVPPSVQRINWCSKSNGNKKGQCYKLTCLLKTWREYGSSVAALYLVECAPRLALIDFFIVFFSSSFDEVSLYYFLQWKGEHFCHIYSANVVKHLFILHNMKHIMNVHV